MSAAIGNTDWKLVGMPAGEGACDHCGRSLKHLYAVADPAGRDMIVGRGCVKKLAGWTLAAAEAKRLLWLAEATARRAAAWAAFAAEFPADAATIEADIAAFEAKMPREIGAGASHEVKFEVSEGRFNARQVREYMRRRSTFAWI